jgi:hypothetical protein
MVLSKSRWNPPVLRDVAHKNEMRPSKGRPPHTQGKLRRHKESQAIPNSPIRQCIRVNEAEARKRCAREQPDACVQKLPGAAPHARRLFRAPRIGPRRATHFAERDRRSCVREGSRELRCRVDRVADEIAPSNGVENITAPRRRRLARAQHARNYFHVSNYLHESTKTRLPRLVPLFLEQPKSLAHSERHGKI